MSSPKSPTSPKSTKSRSKSPPKSKSPTPGVASPARDLLGDASAEIEVDLEDAESVYAQSTVTDTTSLRSSILDFKWENGRRYHAYQDGAYYGPNDERQQEAEDLMHEMFRIILDDRLYVTPIGDNIHRVLDVGCGTGAWAIDFADENPASEVIGIDLSPIQPSFVPPNCKFEVDDITKDWTFPENHFDFIHVRYLTGCIPDWAAFYKKIMRHLKPGGWVEHVELSTIPRADDNTLQPALEKWGGIFEEVGNLTGKTFGACEIAQEQFREAGYENIYERTLKIPIGTWPRDPILKKWGLWNRQFVLQGLEGFSLRALTELLGWSFEEAQLYLIQARQELTDPRVHSYIEMMVVGGQKPLEEE